MQAANMKQRADCSGKDCWHCCSVLKAEAGRDPGTEPLRRNNMRPEGAITQEHNAIAYPEILDLGADTANKATGLNTQTVRGVRDNRQCSQDILCDACQK